MFTEPVLQLLSAFNSYKNNLKRDEFCVISIWANKANSVFRCSIHIQDHNFFSL